MRHRLLLPAIVLGLTLTGCAGPASPVASPAASQPAASRSPTPSSSPTPEDPGSLLVTLDGLEYTLAGTTQALSFDEGEEMRSFLEELTGVSPEGEEVEGPYNSVAYIGYDWDGLQLQLMETDASVAVTGAALGDIPIETSDGISVGTTRAEALAAGAWEEWDEDGDGVADYLGIGSREVEDAESLANPGQPGIIYFLLSLNGDVVEMISFGNDFSDI